MREEGRRCRVGGSEAEDGEGGEAFGEGGEGGLERGGEADVRAKDTDIEDGKQGLEEREGGGRGPGNREGRESPRVGTCIRSRWRANDTSIQEMDWYGCGFRGWSIRLSLARWGACEGSDTLTEGEAARFGRLGSFGPSCEDGCYATNSLW